MNKKWIVLLVLVVLAGAYALRPAAAIPVELVAVERGTVAAEVQDRARTSLPRRHSLAMPIDGRLLPIELKEGDRVEAGQIVARLDTAELDSDVEAAEKRVELAESSIRLNQNRQLLAIAHAEYERLDEAVQAVIESSIQRERASQSQLEYATWWLESIERTTQTGATSEQAVREARMQQATSEVDAATNQLITSAMRAFDAAMAFMPASIDAVEELLEERDVGLQQQLELARLELDRVRRDRARAEIKATTSGVVLTRHYSDERSLTAGTVLLELGELSDMEVMTELLTRDALDVRTGQAAEVLGLPSGSLPARVDRVEPSAFTKLSSLGVEEQRVRVFLTPDRGALTALLESGVPLGVGYSVRARVFVGQRESVLSIPRRALVRSGVKGWSVFVEEDGTARSVALELGLLGPLTAEVRSGLSEGDRVVLSPPAGLSDGERIAAK
jgi:HlyD family secretion protein